MVRPNNGFRRFHTASTRAGHAGIAYSITYSARVRIDGGMVRRPVLGGATADAVLYAVDQRWLELGGAHSACLTEEGRRLMAKEAN
jgi:hypothetical protein